MEFFLPSRAASTGGRPPQVVGVPEEGVIDLAIRPDPYCATDKRAHFQWFSFRLTGASGRRLQLRIVNAGGASYAPAWDGYRACASHDLQDWHRWGLGPRGRTRLLQSPRRAAARSRVPRRPPLRRVPTSYDAASGVLSIHHEPSSPDWVHYSYFAPYSLDRHAALIGRMQVWGRAQRPPGTRPPSSTAVRRQGARCALPPGG
jgi:hypothetical protein